MTPAGGRRRLVTDLGVFVLAAVLGGIPALGLLAREDGDVTALLVVGEAAISREFVERDFPDPVLAPGYGHDGQQFYVMARTFPHFQAADGHVDRLQYRARRVVLPLLVAAAPAGAPTVWAMLAVNLVAIGMAGVALGRLAGRLGASPLVGVVAGVTPALLFSARASLADAPAFALAAWGVVVWRRHPWWAAVLFTSAALAREQALIVPAACLLTALFERGRSRPPVAALATPFAAYGAWAAAVGIWLHPSAERQGGGPLAEAQRLLDVPFRPWLEIGGGQVMIGVAMTGLAAAAAYVLRRDLPEAAWWLAGEALLVVTSSPAISGNTSNYLRVAPLVIPAAALSAALRSRRRRAAAAAPA